MTDVLPPNPQQPAAVPTPPAAPFEPPAQTPVIQTPPTPLTLTLGPEDLSNMIELKQAMVERARSRAEQAALELQVCEADYALLQQMWNRATMDKPIRVQVSN